GGSAVAVGPRGRGDAQRTVGDVDAPAGGDRPPPGNRRGVLANSVGRPQHRVGPTPQRTTRGPTGGGHVVCPVGVTAERLCASPRSRRAGGGLAAGGGHPGRAPRRATGG